MLFFYCFFGFFRNVETQIEEALSCFYVFMAYFCFMLFFSNAHAQIYTHKRTNSQNPNLLVANLFQGWKGAVEKENSWADKVVKGIEEHDKTLDKFYLLIVSLLHRNRHIRIGFHQLSDLSHSDSHLFPQFTLLFRHHLHFVFVPWFNEQFRLRNIPTSTGLQPPCRPRPARDW